MEVFKQKVTLRWADFDPNFHLRHSVYYDLAAALRVDFLEACGITYKMMLEQHIGPVLLREEAVFRREVRPGDQLTLNVVVTKLRQDGSRFSFRHELVREDGTLCATMNVDGAWIDTRIRKMAAPPVQVTELIKTAARSEDFEWV